MGIPHHDVSPGPLPAFKGRGEEQKSSDPGPEEACTPYKHSSWTDEDDYPQGPNQDLTSNDTKWKGR